MGASPPFGPATRHPHAAARRGPQRELLQRAHPGVHRGRAASRRCGVVPGADAARRTGRRERLLKAGPVCARDLEGTKYVIFIDYWGTRSGTDRNELPSSRLLRAWVRSIYAGKHEHPQIRHGRGLRSVTLRRSGIRRLRVPRSSGPLGIPPQFLS